jgi:hypothetical protein
VNPQSPPSRASRGGGRPTTSFYCVTGRDFFPGAVALLNSLRLAGHDESLVVLDAGMDPRQREALAAHARIVDAPADLPPSMLKLAAPLAHPADVMVLLDADLIVTRRLAEPIRMAAAGRVVGFENDRHRFFAEWQQALGLEINRAGPYLTSSALFLGGETGAEVAAAAQERLSGLDVERTWLGRGTEADPLFYADQDVLNAVLLSLPADRVIALDQRLAAIPPFAGLRVADMRTLRCAYPDGSEPFALHHFHRKPWLVRMRSNVYSRLMTRLLFAGDVTLRLDARDLPARMRPGPGGAVARVATDVLFGIPSSAKRRLTPPPRDAKAWSDAPTSEAGGRETAR